MKQNLILLVLALLGSMAACKEKRGSKPADSDTNKAPAVVRMSPAFNPDTAYQHVVKQVSFGPRVPNTAAHTACAEWLEATLKRYGARVTVQRAQVKDHTGKLLNIRNLIASFDAAQPTAERVMVSAHWDTRPIADMDQRDPDSPIPGANDGGSGVAVLLEIARQLGIAKTTNKPLPAVAVDLMFWDAEDGGDPDLPEEDTYCLGSQYWGRNPHVPGYKARWCINLDMVGAQGATFPLEGNSRKAAPKLLEQVWRTAADLGYGVYFLNQPVGNITDDHYYVTEIAGIPAIDIIHLDASGRSAFFDQWHTHDDNIGIISRETLGALGQTVLEVLYREPEKVTGS